MWRMNKSALVSIIISNYNYGSYLGAAIESSLAQTYCNIEVIVVDDGSTDNSREIINRYGTHIIPVLKDNGGQASSINVGFSMSKGELIFFLDADDMLESKAVETVINEWRDGVARILFPLEVIDKSGRPLGQMVGGTALPSPLLGPFGVGSPTSGNAFSRRALEKILPMPAVGWSVSPDFYLIASGLFGEVGCLRKPLGKYRIHGANNVACADSLEVIRNRLFLDVRLHDLLFRLMEGKVGSLEQWLSGCPEHWIRRIISLREGPCDHPWQDTILRLIVQAVESTWRQPNRNIRRRLAYSVFAVGYGVAPRKIINFMRQIDTGERGRGLRKFLGARI